MMKKHEMVLDFTSLLDVILIILFLVLCSMNGKAQKDAKKIDDLEASTASLTSENGQLQGQIDDLEKQKSELEALLEEARKASLEKGQEVDRLQAEINRLSEQTKTLADLVAQYGEIQKLRPNDAKKYELFKGNAIAVELSLSDPNPNATQHIQCKVNMLVEGLKSANYLIEDTHNKPSVIDKYTNELSSWLKNELEKIYKTEECSIYLIIIDYDDNQVMVDSVEIVKNAVSHIDSDKYLIILYDKTQIVN